MSAPIRKPSLRKRGSVAVECAIVLPILLLLISGLLFFARVFWCYTVAQKAAHDGARFLAATTVREIAPSSAGPVVPVAVVAQKIAMDELAELNPGGGISATALCYVGSPTPYWDLCYGYDVPKKVSVRVTVSVSDPFFDPFTELFTDGGPIILRAVMATDYVGG
jgi:Flp pilus assembly protein TadG